MKLMTLVHKVLKLKLTYFGHVVGSDDREKSLCLELEMVGEVGVDRGGDGWTRWWGQRVHDNSLKEARSRQGGIERCGQSRH